MAGRHATLDFDALIGTGEDARAVCRVCWPVQRGRGCDLLPTEGLVQRLDGVVGHMRATVDFEIYNWIWAAGQVTFLIGVKSIGDKTTALNGLASNGAKRVNGMHRCTGKVLCRNKSSQAVDAAAAEAAMTDLIRQAVVERVTGGGCPASSGTRVLTNPSVVGIWVDRAAMHRAKHTDESAHVTAHTLALDQLPHMKHLTATAYRAHWQAVAERLEARVRAGLATESDATPDALPYFGRPDAVAAAMGRYRTRVEAIRAASQAWRAYARGRRSRPLRYPEGTHCPGALCRALVRALARCAGPPTPSG